MAVYVVKQGKTYVGTAAEMAAFTGMAPGEKFFQSDTGFWYVYGGASWVKELTPAS